MADDLVVDEVVKEKVVKAKDAVKKSTDVKMYISLDKSVQDVIQCIEDGRHMLFADKEDTFLELPSEVYKMLPLEDKERYLLAKEICLNGLGSVIKSATEGLQGWSIDFDIQPGDPSDKLAVHNKKPGYDYYLARPDRLAKKASEHWEIDKDPDIRMFGQATSDIGKAVPKAVGGRKSSELVLVRRRKEISEKVRKERDDRYNSYTDKAKDQFREDVEKSGGKASLDE